jgi:hypothetical protein
MTTIDIRELTAIPYLDVANLNGRTISSLMFHDAGSWRTWIAAGDRLIEVRAWPAESFYFSKVEANPNDIAFHFLDFMAQHASFPQVTLALSGISDDIFNLSASLAKIEHLHATRDAIGHGCHRMATSEVEYVFLVCRSIFDLLQEIASKLWETITLTDASIEKKPLMKSFNAMTRYKGKPVTREILARRFGLPDSFADFYVKWQGFFELLRGFRDNVVHHGSQVQTIFNDEKGFMIAKSLRPFGDMDMWRDNERLPNEVVPLMPALGVVIYKTLAACEDFSRTLSTIIKFPPPIAPGMHLFMRGYFNESLTRILQDAAERLALPAPSPEVPTVAEPAVASDGAPA